MFQSTRPRGARLIAGVVGWKRSLFQSTRPRGARLSNESHTVPTDAFQSTRPRGARRILRGRLWGVYGFNPRARVGRDRA